MYATMEPPPGWPTLIADVLARPGGSGLVAALDRPIGVDTLASLADLEV